MVRFHRWLNHLRNACVVLGAAPLSRRAVNLVRTLSIGVDVCNPSVVVFEGRLLAAARVPGYRIEKGLYRFTSQEPFASRTLLLELTSDLEILKTQEIRTEMVRSQLSEATDGLEDPRLYISDGRLMCLWSGLNMAGGRPKRTSIGAAWKPNWAESRNTMITAHLVDGVAVEAFALQSPHAQQREKNWMPLSPAAPQTFCYQLATQEFYEWTDRQLLPKRDGTVIYTLVGWSGSSQFIPWGGGWIGVVHKAVRGNPLLRRRWPASYVHKFVVLDENLHLEAQSRSFCFFSRGIEFCAGIARVEDDIVLSFGVDDSSAFVLRLPVDSVKRMLRTRR